MTESAVLLLSGAFGAAVIKLLDGVVQFLLQRRAKRQDQGGGQKTEMERRIDAMADCLMASTMDRIQYLCKCYIKDGCVDVEDLRRLHIMHEKYHNLGGNGDLNNLIEQVDNLPLKV